MIADVVVRRNVGDRGDLRHADRARVLPVRPTIGREHAAVTIGPQSHEHSAMVKEPVHRLLVDGFQMIDLKKRIKQHPGLRVRVSFPDSDAAAVQSGARISLRARLMPPAPAAVPGGYEFARLAWFKGIGDAVEGRTDRGIQAD